MTGTWIGLKEANAALRRLPEHVQPRVQKIIDTSAFQLARGAASKAPVASGTLKQSIGWKSRPRSLSAIVFVDSPGFYWKYIEYGTVKRPARPFIRPIGEAMSADHDARMTQALEMALTQVEREARV
jgi:HK97 gp10 family phage protein